MLASVLISLLLAGIIRFCVPMICISFAAAMSRDFTFGDYFSRMQNNGYINSVFERICIYGMMLSTIIMCLFMRVFWFKGLMINIICIVVLTGKCIMQKQTATAFCWCYNRKSSRTAGMRSMRGNMYGNRNGMYGSQNNLYGNQRNQYGMYNSMYGNCNMYGRQYNQQYASQYANQYGQQFANPLAYRNLPVDPETGLPIKEPSLLSVGYKRFKKSFLDTVDKLNSSDELTPEEQEELKEERVQDIAAETAVFNEAGVERPVDTIGEFAEDDAKKINNAYNTLVEPEPERFKINGSNAVRLVDYQDIFILQDSGSLVYTRKSDNKDTEVKPVNFDQNLHAAVFTFQQLKAVLRDVGEEDNDIFVYVLVIQEMKNSRNRFVCLDSMSGDYLPNALPLIIGFEPNGVYTIGEDTYTVFKNGNGNNTAYMFGFRSSNMYVLKQMYLIKEPEICRVVPKGSTWHGHIEAIGEMLEVNSLGICLKFTDDGKPVMKQEAVREIGYDPVSRKIDLGLDPDEISAEIEAIYTEPDEEKRKEVRQEIMAERKGEVEPKKRTPRRLNREERAERREHTTQKYKKKQEKKAREIYSREGLSYVFCSYPDEFKVTCGKSVEELNRIKSELIKAGGFNVDRSKSEADKALRQKYLAWKENESGTNQDNSVEESTEVKKIDKQSLLDEIMAEKESEAKLAKEHTRLTDLNNLEYTNEVKEGIEDMLKSQTKSAE